MCYVPITEKLQHRKRMKHKTICLLLFQEQEVCFHHARVFVCWSNKQKDTERGWYKHRNTDKDTYTDTDRDLFEFICLLPPYLPAKLSWAKFLYWFPKKYVVVAEAQKVFLENRKCPKSLHTHTEFLNNVKTTAILNYCRELDKFEKINCSETHSNACTYTPPHTTHTPHYIVLKKGLSRHIFYHPEQQQYWKGG